MLRDAITVQAYDDDSAEYLDHIKVEMNSGMVDLIVAPYTPRAATYSLGAEEAWQLIRELARAVVEAEEEE